jgi:hypothetical protein
MAKRAEIPEWETLLAHAAALQAKIPSAILVGGTAAAVHSRHRFSIDHDHVGANLANNYDTAIRVGNYRWLAYKSPSQRENGAHTPRIASLKISVVNLQDVFNFYRSSALDIHDFGSTR